MNQDYDEDEDVPTGNSTTNHANSLWSPQNQMQLICEVRHQIPRKDTLPFDERVMKIKWTNINIGNYSPKELEDEFSNLVKRSRQFRILEEIIKDQELEIMPQLGLSKPVGPFILFMRDNKDKLARMNDTVSKVGSYTKLAAKLFQECGEKERNRYIAMSKDMMKKYKEGLSRYNFSNKGRPVKNERKPKRTKDNPTEFFVKSKALEDPSVSKAYARKMYLELNRSKKLKWILRWLALKKGQKANMAEYSKCQSNLTKDELSIYDEYEGKPQIKSGYHIFLRDFIATLDSEDSAHNSPLKLAVQKWKTLSESKKAEYNKQSKMAKKAFTVSFSRYIASLPEDRQIHEINMLSSPKKEVKKRPVATVTKKAKNNTSMNVSNHEISERSDSELDDEDPPETIFQIDTSTKVASHSSLIDDEDGDEVVQKIYLPSPVIVAKRKRSLSPQFLNSRERKSPSPRKKPEKSKQLDISEYFQSPSTSKKNKKASSRDIEIAKSIEKFKAEKPPEDILAFYAQEENLSLKRAKKAFSSLTSLKKAAIDKKMKRAKEKYLKKVEKFTGSLSEAELEGSLQHPRVEVANDIVNVVQSKSKSCSEIVTQMQQMSKALIEFANKDIKTTVALSESMRKLKNLLRCVQCPTLELPVSPSNHYDVISVVQWKDKITSVGGLNAPKKILCLCYDGIERPQLLKGKDDLRQDAIMQQALRIVNDLLLENKETFKRKLSIRTYKVVPLSMRSGILEWCENTTTLGLYLVGPKKDAGAHKKYRPQDYTPAKCHNSLFESQKKSYEAKYKLFQDICKHFKPVFHNFFFEKFLNPGVWFEKRLAYTNSVATTSIVGYILGLGDRHVQNILIDETTAEVIHIDFGIAFEQGKVMPTAEAVPFRLTRDIVAPFGICEVDGIFRKSCEKTMEVLRQNQSVLITTLEVLLYDPLYTWILKKDITNKKIEVESNLNKEEKNSTAQRALIRVRSKLTGMEEGCIGITSVEGQVHRLIKQAMDLRNLSRMFHGWSPHL